MSENLAEIEFTKTLFGTPDARALMASSSSPVSSFPGAGGEAGKQKEWDGTYAGVYDAFGLLGPRTILAHCVHLEERELETLRRTGAGVSHCPTSNFNIRSGCARVGEMLDRGIKVCPLSSRTGRRC